MMKRIFSVLVACALASTGWAAGVSDKELQMVADAINKKAPMMVDQETQLTGATGANNTLTYNYKMINYTVAQLDTKKFTSILEPQLKQVACPKIKPMLDAGITAVYAYKDKDGAMIASISMDKAACK